MKVKCPTCEKEIEYSTDNPFRPFCSERCKLIDLGEWASGERFIPGEPDWSLDDEEPQDKPLH
ncbi:DNA gyrase inhibitor YacG [Ketobacter alkanivorans]|uniref:DNA gyrase inhibitor YacG n=1 Tax=Ketobacter alkanivorans TaxID=1917421 RepID=A0A2K9LRL9_9GAMM|nr:DNA gyrase inhibitor YacG [Ketobacter alkanivorans]AUM14105.1 DNA gyrase inhibitor YacG [Ketobacter alkanivorans]MCP5017732.1 DNA gyrase inhibitor YacG [Ketobacter sp.]